MATKNFPGSHRSIGTLSPVNFSVDLENGPDDFVDVDVIREWDKQEFGSNSWAM